MDRVAYMESLMGDGVSWGTGDDAPEPQYAHVDTKESHFISAFFPIDRSVLFSIFFF